MLAYLLAGSALGPVVSQTLLDISIVLLFLVFIVQSVKNKSYSQISFRKPFVFEYGIFFYILAILTGFYILNITDREAWVRLLKFTWIINLYLFAWAISKINFDFRKMLLFFSAAYLIPNIYALSTFIAKVDWLSGLPIQNSRIIGMVKSSTYHAHANALVLVFFAVIFFFAYSKLSRRLQVITTISFLLMLASTILALTRGIWISLTFTFLFFLFVQNKKLFAAALVVGAIAFTSLLTFSESFQNRVSLSSHTQSSDAERLNLFKVHVFMIKESPLVGIGYANPLSHTKDWWPKMGLSSDLINSHAHNQLLNVWATTGLIGLIPFMLFYFWFLVKSWQLSKQFKKLGDHPKYVLAMACLMTQVQFIVGNFTDIGFEYAKIRSLILLVWAIVLGLWLNKIKVTDAN